MLRLPILFSFLLFTAGLVKNTVAQSPDKNPFMVQDDSLRDPKSTMELSYNDALQIMMKENLELVAAHYDIDISQGDLLQKQAWNNPHFNWNQDLYSVEHNDYFNAKNQKLIQVDQMFSIAGKHTRTVALAKINVELNKLMYEDVKRSLIYELGIKYNELHALHQKQELYKTAIAQFKKLIDGFEIQFKAGAIPGSEVLRLRSEMIAMQNEVTENENLRNSTMSELKFLLNIKPEIFIKTIETTKIIPEQVSFSELVTEAEKSRPDYLLKQKGIEYEQTNLKLQQSIAYPDMMIGYQPTDKGSNYVRPYTGLVVEFDLPVFNRNQGNIMSARSQVMKAETEQQQQGNILQNEVSSALFKMLNTRKALENYSADFLQKLVTLKENALTNYNKKNIGMLEYIDIQRIYMRTMMEYTELKAANIENINELNFTIGKPIY